MSINNQLFKDRCREYFEKDCKEFLESLEKPCTQAFFLNTRKAEREKIFEIIDFNYHDSPLSDQSFYHESDNIGKSKAYELGLIYPQEIAASLSSLFIDKNNIGTVVDMCAAPGGKTINVLNRLPEDVLCISNDVNHTRVLSLSSNLERLGLDNVIITNKKTEDLSQQLEGCADLVILDAPCSGEGMIRKYPEILDDYSINNIDLLSKTQSKLLDEAYMILNKGGQLLYSTCTYAMEEDERQISDFLERYPDMKLVPLDMKSSSKLEGTIKLSPLNNTEGQFIALMKKEGTMKDVSLRSLKPVKEKLVDDFIKENLLLDEYYLYKNNEHFFLSLRPLPDLKYNVMKYGIYAGEVKNRRFEPNHNLYRANSLKGKFRYVYDLNDVEYDQFISGNEFKADLGNHYYLLTYKGYSLGFGKCSNGMMKNKYPKGLRRMI
ncbi:MAG: hypothetical protein IJH00_01580 [Erysipelotrichaceae bacterium]|nr:hypothetical protein [Erysipelotrichaceae bacterium]